MVGRVAVAVGDIRRSKRVTRLGGGDEEVGVAMGILRTYRSGGQRKGPGVRALKYYNGTRCQSLAPSVRNVESPAGNWTDDPEEFFIAEPDPTEAE